MRSAPSVSFPVGRCALGPTLALGTWLAGLATLLAWCALDRALDWRQLLAALALAATGYAAWRDLRATPRGLLDWDGGQWSWFSGEDEAVVRVEPVADLQRWMLVRLLPGEAGGTGRWEVGSGARWLWLTRGKDLQHWRSLRRAVYFSHTTKALREGLH